MDRCASAGVVAHAMPGFRQLLNAIVPLCFGATAACGQPTLEDLWEGRARFEQVGELEYGPLHPNGVAIEHAGWYAVANGRWYAFSRAPIGPKPAYCPHDHAAVHVRESADKGRSWSKAVTAAAPGWSASGDGCAVLDGSSFYDRSTGTWHLLAQCMDRENRGGWSLCHYARRSPSPLGPFVPDPANPVVRGGQLWKSICAGAGKSCPAGIVDEGTPDIVEKRGAHFIVSLHGFDQRTGKGYRTVVATPDFRSWAVAGGGLPGDAVLTAAECSRWLPGCVGFGQATAIRSGGRIYVVAEAMDRSLLCQKNQKWTFALLRSKQEGWPRSGRRDWEAFRTTPLLRPRQPDPQTPCQISYARWLVDGADTYLIYEELDPKRPRLNRRLLKLVWTGK